VVKFYRPGRWTREAILEEHGFLADCAAAELPVVLPIEDPEGSTLPEIGLEGKDGGELSFLLALFPKSGGRNFEPETTEDWLRLGSLVGRLHAVGGKRKAQHRLSLDPALGRSYLQELLDARLIHPECRGEFEELANAGLAMAETRLAGLPLQRVHGDLHRGNILDRPGKGLVLVDFDDMVMGPAVQDLWLLLPGRRQECGRELALLSEGYEDFAFLDPASYGAIESLRLLRMLYFLCWRARQRQDYWFAKEFPDWGGRAFWLTEVEDLRDQVDCLQTEGKKD
jgi:Ser/Thr protein kinase RdoA (MazF antagonist)